MTSELMNIILGGGLIGTVVAILTLQATVRKAKAEAMRAEADAESMRIDNAEHATRILMENIVKPLKEEFNETKQELENTKKELARNTREMARLRKSIDTANGCKHRDNCPVLYGLRKYAEGADGDPHGGHPEVRGHKTQPVRPGDGGHPAVRADPEDTGA